MNFVRPALAALATLTLGLALATAATGASAQTVDLKTNLGDIRIQLDADKAPKTVANFLAYVKSGYYNGTIFHRVIDGFMIQGGGYSAKLQGKPTRPPIPLEADNGLLNARGTIAMARTAEPNSATSQFFINVGDNAGLDAANSRDGKGYAVFGHVIEGMDVVDAIRMAQTHQQGYEFQNLPDSPITIIKATVESKK